MNDNRQCRCSFVPEFKASCEESTLIIPCKMGSDVYVVTKYGFIDTAIVIGAYDKYLNGDLLIIAKRSGGDGGYDLSLKDKDCVWFLNEAEAMKAAENVKRIMELEINEKV